MTQDILAIRIKDSGLLALPIEVGRQYKLQEGDVLTLLSLSDQAFLLVRLPEKRPTLPELQSSFGQALVESGYDSREKIIELVREVKREYAADSDKK